MSTRDYAKMQTPLDGHPHCMREWKNVTKQCNHRVEVSYSSQKAEQDLDKISKPYLWDHR